MTHQEQLEAWNEDPEVKPDYYPYSCEDEQACMEAPYGDKKC